MGSNINVGSAKNTYRPEGALTHTTLALYITSLYCKYRGKMCVAVWLSWNIIIKICGCSGYCLFGCEYTCFNNVGDVCASTAVRYLVSGTLMFAIICIITLWFGLVLSTRYIRIFEYKKWFLCNLSPLATSFRFVHTKWKITLHFHYFMLNV